LFHTSLTKKIKSLSGIFVDRPLPAVLQPLLTRVKKSLKIVNEIANGHTMSLNLPGTLKKKKFVTDNIDRHTVG